MSGKVEHPDPGTELSYAEYLAEHTITPGTMGTWIANHALLMRRTPKFIIVKDGSYARALDCRTQQFDYESTDIFSVFQGALTDMVDGERLFIENGSYDFNAGTGGQPNILNAGIVIEGESRKTKIIPKTGNYAFKIGQGTTTYPDIVMKTFSVESSAGAGNGVHCDKADDVKLIDLLLIGLGTSLKIEDSARSHVLGSDLRGFTGYGIHYPAGPIADQFVNDAVLDTAAAAAIGICAEEGVNGLRLSDILLAGVTTGLDYGIKVTGSYSGGWFKNVVIDNIVGTGMRFEDGATYGCAGFQIDNSWMMSCGEHGMEIEGALGRECQDFLISNSQLKFCDYAALKMEYASIISLNNCHISEGGQAEIADNKLMTNLYLGDNVQTTSFNHCWLGWFRSTPANRAYPVEIVVDRGTVGTPTYTTVKFNDCYIKDPSSDEGSRIQYLRETVYDHIYIFGRDCATNNFASEPDNTLVKKDAAGETADQVDEHECIIPMVFNW